LEQGEIGRQYSLGDGAVQRGVESIYQMAGLMRPFDANFKTESASHMQRLEPPLTVPWVEYVTCQFAMLHKHVDALPTKELTATIYQHQDKISDALCLAGPRPWLNTTFICYLLAASVSQPSLTQVALCLDSAAVETQINAHVVTRQTFIAISCKGQGVFLAAV
jgi:hypothetical protein